MMQKYIYLILLFWMLLLVAYLLVKNENINQLSTSSYLVDRKKVYSINRFKSSKSKLSGLKKFKNQANVSKAYEFDINNDLMIFLHIQKSGGSMFESNIVNYLQIYEPTLNEWKNMCGKDVRGGRKDYTCPVRLKSENGFQHWFLDRKTAGWICGVHPDYTRLRNCARRLCKTKNHLFITNIRDPIKRYLSELGHIQNGAIWDGSKNVCSPEGSKVLDTCFGKDRRNLSLDRFLSSCKGHIAKNRIVRFLASYNEESKDCKIFEPSQSPLLLESAKNNLLKMKYFAINDYQSLSQKLFEATFRNLRFSKQLLQPPRSKAEDHLKHLDKSVIDRIRATNSLDVELYEYALDLFFYRLDKLKIINFTEVDSIRTKRVQNLT
jgi:hypothetical protein